MESKNIATSKVSRTLKTTSIAARAGVQHLGYLGKKHFVSDKQKHKEQYEEALGKKLFKGLSQMRGTALKASQILSMESDFIPEGVRKELEKSCYKVPPLNRALIRKVFKEEFSEQPNTLFASFEPTAFAAASLGQVHRATLENGERLAVKIQYPGIRESIDSDLKLMRILFSTLSLTTDYLPNKHVIERTLDTVEHQLQEEIDYEKEAYNTRWFRDNLKLDGVVVPRVIEQYSSRRIISFEFLDGLHIDHWLAKNPSQEAINQAGQLIFNIFMHTAFRLKSIHADPHLGNYLFLDDGQIGLLDFGCVKHLSDGFVEKISELYSALLEGNHELSMDKYQALNIMSKDMSVDVYKNEVLPAIREVQQWLVEPFKNDTFDFKQLKVPPKAEPELHKRAIRHFHDLHRDQIYFDRTFMGVLQLLKKMGAEINTRNPWIK